MKNLAYNLFFRCASESPTKLQLPIRNLKKKVPEQTLLCIWLGVSVSNSLFTTSDIDSHGYVFRSAPNKNRFRTVETESDYSQRKNREYPRPHPPPPAHRIAFNAPVYNTPSIIHTYVCNPPPFGRVVMRLCRIRENLNNLGRTGGGSNGFTFIPFVGEGGRKGIRI